MTGRIHGIVLAGGESRRMGRDKALVRLDGLRLVDRTVARLVPQVAALAVSRHAGGLDGLPPGVALVTDGAGAHAGPLAGLLAGLDWVAARDPAATHAVTVPVDAPLLPDDLVARLSEARAAAGADAAVALSGDRRHSVTALWPVSARGVLRAALEVEELRRVGLFLDRLGPAEARWPCEPHDPFLNVNQPDDLAAAEAALRAIHDRTATGTGAARRHLVGFGPRPA